MNCFVSLIIFSGSNNYLTIFVNFGNERFIVFPAGARDPSPITSTCDCFHFDAAAAAAAAAAGVSRRHWPGRQGGRIVSPCCQFGRFSAQLGYFFYSCTGKMDLVCVIWEAFCASWEVVT